jgi:GNAT superfamily N-acetyltransferase
VNDHGLSHRRAGRDDIESLRQLSDRSIGELQRGFLTAAQIEASRAIMGVDTQLIDDGTYFVVEIEGHLAGCGGWSRRATLYGGDQTSGRDEALLVPGRDAAKVRAMYTSPAFARRGVGRHILELCENDARDEGFDRLELMATMAGRPLYESYGFVPIEEFLDDRGGSPVPLVRMTRPIRK